ADEGLGGKRSQGMGTFSKVEEEKWPAGLFAGESEYYASLSVVYPQIEEVNKVVFYELIERSGYLHSQQGRSLRKKRVNLLKEGSVFSAKISGRLIDVRPNRFSTHPVYLNGKGFLIPIGEV
ncbi:MAG: type III-A CRISPR-associated RAMP protein Csm4, partial [Bacteroidales bacterium]|nr:type III-A CRISPR-associated RAMP protein Csm4 [Bacteroidales bacterium]